MPTSATPERVYDAAVTSDCLFCRIAAGEIPSTVVYETDQVLAFRDINPQAPTHVVVIPKAHYPDMASLAQADAALAGSVLAASGAVARQEGVAESGYRVVFNTGPEAGQSVLHVHAHVLGGRAIAWPPG
jgi:histidine triad (HIT) family protein